MSSIMIAITIGIVWSPERTKLDFSSSLPICHWLTAIGGDIVLPHQRSAKPFYMFLCVYAASVGEIGGARVVRRMLFEADDVEPAAANSRRFSLPAVPLTSVVTDTGRQHKTPTKCNYWYCCLSRISFAV